MPCCPTCGQSVANDEYAQLRGVILCRRRKQILNALIRARGEYVTGDDIAAYVYKDASGGPDDAMSSIYTHMYHLRKDLAPLGWAVKMSRYQGYYLERMTP